MKTPLFSGAFFQRGVNALLGLVFPEGNVCHICGQPMLHGTEVWLCEPCGTELAGALIPPSEQPLFIDPQLPFAAAAYPYLSIAQELVHQLKYNGDAAAAAPLAEGMAAAFASCPELRSATLVLPIPLHSRREAERGYNQAALLAEGLSSFIGLPCQSSALTRIRYTRPQVGVTRGHRLKNMIGAFIVAEIPLVYGQHILLIDDVCTTGATAIACAHVLLSCGARQVSLLTACRA